MNPIIDHLLVAAIILGALAFFAKRMFWHGKKSCGSDCGCGVSRDKIKQRG